MSVRSLGHRSSHFSSKDAFEYFHYLGAQTSTWATRDGVALRLEVLSPLFEGALVRAGSMFASPAFTGDDLARARRDASTIAARQRQSPSATAQRTVRAMVLGKDHPYATPVYAGADARYEKMSILRGTASRRADSIDRDLSTRARHPSSSGTNSRRFRRSIRPSSMPRQRDSGGMT